MVNYQIIRFLSTWQVINKKTSETILEEPFPYNRSIVLENFFQKVSSCTTDQDVYDLWQLTKGEMEIEDEPNN